MTEEDPRLSSRTTFSFSEEGTEVNIEPRKSDTQVACRKGIRTREAEDEEENCYEQVETVAYHVTPISTILFNIEGSARNE